MSDRSEIPGRSIVVVGAGGNIGSQLMPHLARMPAIDRITLIDKDVYETSNLKSQNIMPRDVGQKKAMVQARRIKGINAEVRVETIADAVERVPLGRLRADVMLACLDSRISRQHVSQFAWRLGVPLIDAGVEPGGLLARINVYVPGPENACMECAWDDRDYDALEQTYPCTNSNLRATNAPTSLGALAASLQAIECQKLLNGRECAAVDRQVTIDALHHKHYVTSFRRSPKCRFASHDIWSIKQLNCSARDLTFADALSLARKTGVAAEVSLGLESKPFVTRLICGRCGESRSLLRLECSLSDRQRACSSCGEWMSASGFDLAERLGATLGVTVRQTRSLHSLGLRNGDVFSVGAGHNDLHYEIACLAAEDFDKKCFARCHLD